MPLPGRTTRSNESLTQKNTLGTMGRTLMSTVSFAKPRGVNWADKRQGATVVETSSQPRVKSGIRWMDNLLLPKTRKIVWAGKNKGKKGVSGEKRFIFAQNDRVQSVTIDLGQERRIHSIGAKWSTKDRAVRDYFQVEIKRDEKKSKKSKKGKKAREWELVGQTDQVHHSPLHFSTIGWKPAKVRFIRYTFGRHSKDHNNGGCAIHSLYVHGMITYDGDSSTTGESTTVSSSAGSTSSAAPSSTSRSRTSRSSSTRKSSESKKSSRSRYSYSRGSNKSSKSKSLASHLAGGNPTSSSAWNFNTTYTTDDSGGFTATSSAADRTSSSSAAYTTNSSSAAYPSSTQSTGNWFTRSWNSLRSRSSGTASSSTAYNTTTASYDNDDYSASGSTTGSYSASSASSSAGRGWGGSSSSSSLGGRSEMGLTTYYASLRGGDKYGVDTSGTIKKRNNIFKARVSNGEANTSEFEAMTLANTSWNASNSLSYRPGEVQTFGLTRPSSSSSFEDRTYGYSYGSYDYDSYDGYGSYTGGW